MSPAASRLIKLSKRAFGRVIGLLHGGLAKHDTSGSHYQVIPA